jgi:hypothetical protein
MHLDGALGECDGVILEGSIHLRLRQVHRVASRCPAADGDIQHVRARCQPHPGRPRANREGSLVLGSRHPRVAGQLDDKVRSCHLLFASGVTPAQVTAIVAAVRGTPVLTISDVDDFARQGGIAQMFVENSQMRLDLNLEAARRSRLDLSSKLLILAAHVDDEAKAPGQ